MKALDPDWDFRFPWHITEDIRLTNTCKKCTNINLFYITTLIEQKQSLENMHRVGESRDLHLPQPYVFKSSCIPCCGAP